MLDEAQGYLLQADGEQQVKHNATFTHSHNSLAVLLLYLIAIQVHLNELEYEWT